MRGWIILAVVVVVLAAAWFFLRRWPQVVPTAGEVQPGSQSGFETGAADVGPPATSAPAPLPPVEPSEAAGPVAAPGPAADPANASPLEDLREALEGADKESAREAAAKLRQLARTDPGVRELLGNTLLDQGEDQELRISMAAILGTFPEGEPWLAEALRESFFSAEVLPWVIYALGAFKEGEDDDFFGGLDGPFVEETPGGLQLFVKSPIVSEEVRDLLSSRLLRSETHAVQQALVRALRHSLEFSNVRMAFGQRIEAENNQDLQAEMAAGLARWAVGATGGEEIDRVRIGHTLFRLAGDPGQDHLRLQLQPYAAQLAWPPGQADRLLDLAGNATVFDQRYWAIEVIGRQPGHFTGEQSLQAEQILVSILLGERDDKLREKAAAALGAHEQTVVSSSTLRGLAQQDPAWNVRLAALKSLGKIKSLPQGTLEVLSQIAAGDPHEAVRSAASETLQSVQGGR